MCTRYDAGLMLHLLFRSSPWLTIGIRRVEMMGYKSKCPRNEYSTYSRVLVDHDALHDSIIYVYVISLKSVAVLKLHRLRDSQRFNFQMLTKTTLRGFDQSAARNDPVLQMHICYICRARQMCFFLTLLIRVARLDCHKSGPKHLSKQLIVSYCTSISEKPPCTIVVHRQVSVIGTHSLQKLCLHEIASHFRFKLQT